MKMLQVICGMWMRGKNWKLRIKKIMKYDFFYIFLLFKKLFIPLHFTNFEKVICFTTDKNTPRWHRRQPTFTPVVTRCVSGSYPPLIDYQAVTYFTCFSPNNDKFHANVCPTTRQRLSYPAQTFVQHWTNICTTLDKHLPKLCERSSIFDKRSPKLCEHSPIFDKHSSNLGKFFNLKSFKVLIFIKFFK